MIRTRPLVIGPETLREIETAIARARMNPIPWQTLKATAVDTPGPMLALKDRKPGARPASIFVEIPFGFRVAISFEEQPVGLCRHISISVETSPQGKLPHMEAVKAIAEAFGIDIAKDYNSATTSTWVEEFAPGEFAINVLRVEPKSQGSSLH